MDRRIKRPGPLRSAPANPWRTVLVIGAGGFAGGLARYGIGVAWPTTPGGFPWATFTVNTSGAFALAFLLVVALEMLPPSPYLRPALGTGFCGAYTTFSTVTVASDQLAGHGHAALALAYLGASILAGLAATLLGLAIGRTVASSRPVANS